MPPKIKPRPRQSARNDSITTREHDSVGALSAPSPKEALANDDNEVQDTSGNAEQTDIPELQTEGSSSRGISAPTPSIVRGAPSSRRSVQRLKSALPRNSPNPASNLHGADGSDSRPAGLKFKPKSFIRRSKEEREAEEKVEAERRAARQAAEGTSSPNDRGGYYGRGRALGQRGGFGDTNKWKNERFNLSHEASGHLGGSTIQDPPTSRNRRGGGFRSSTSGTSERASTDGTARAKKEPAVKPKKDKDGDVVMGSSSKPKRMNVKKEEKGPTYISSESELDSDGEERVNIDDISTINLVSSEDDDEESVQRSRMSKGKRREVTPRVPSSNLMPVRIQRQEHVERAVGVNTDASSLTSAELRRRAKNRAEAAGSLFLPEQEESDVVSLSKPKVKRKPKDVEFVRDERKWKGVYQEEDDKEGMVKIKTEPKEEREVVMTDKPMDDGEVEPTPLGDIDFAITSTQRSVKDDNDKLTLRGSQESIGEAPEVETSQSGEKLQKIKGYHGLRPVSISEEEEEEDILAEIAEIVLSKSDVSGNMSNPELASSTKAFDEDGDLDMDHEDTYFQKDGREEVYLFQLPPVVPSLRDISKAIPKSEEKKKNKAVPAEVPRSASNNPFAAQVKDEPGIKPDPDELPHEIPVPHAYTSDSFPSIGGRGGVVSIHAKGSMFATWGGMSFEIAKEGTGAQLAQELMMTEYESAVTKVEDESRWEEKVDVGKRGWAMGQTHPGHVCVPELLS